jgi:hypothetical protein
VKAGRIGKPEFLKMAATALRNVKMASRCFEDFGLGADSDDHTNGQPCAGFLAE